MYLEFLLSNVINNCIANLVRTVVQPSMEQVLEKHEVRLRHSTARVRTEVDMAHMEFIQTQLASIESFIDASSTPRYLSLPIVRLIPHSRNHRFFGRQGILDIMREQLSPSRSDRQRVFALSGPGGSGKTQIALEYTYRFLEDYKIVIWILADSPEKIAQSFGKTADVMRMQRGTQSVQ